MSTTLNTDLIPAAMRTPESLPRLEALREHFVSLRFGAFIHFNMGTSHSEQWIAPRQDPQTFNPHKLDCGQWMDVMAFAGMRYAVLTTKHHDGFCLWPSRQTDYTVAASSLAGRDIVREYANACRARGVEPHLCFSIWDRQQGIERDGDNPLTAEAKRFIKDQLAELLTGYGPIGSLTFDGWGNWKDMPVWVEEDYNEIYAHIKSIQPDCLVTDHVQMMRASRRKEISFDQAYAINDIFHFEEPMGEWAWAPEGNRYASHQGPMLQRSWFWETSFPTEPLMSVDEIVNKHLRVLGPRRCNLLLNCAPNPEGLLDDNVVRRLTEVGEELQAHPL